MDLVSMSRKGTNTLELLLPAGLLNLTFALYSQFLGMGRAEWE